MKIRKIIISSIFLAIGFILHQVTPPIFMGMKPDFLLSMMFIAILFNDDIKITLITSIVAGILSALTTAFPGGQIPNIVDKLVVAQCIFFMNKAFKNVPSRIKLIVIFFIGTIISGSVFLGTALLITGMKISFGTLMLTVILPAAVINCITGFIIYNIVLKSNKILNKTQRYTYK